MKPDLTIVHPELQQAARFMPRFNFSSRNLWFWRLMDKMLWNRKPPQDVAIRTVFAPRQDPPARVPLRLYRAGTASAPVPALLWFHGGGYVGGSVKQDDPICIQYARELGIVVVSVDYRRAPEHPFPAALHDGYAALAWVAANGAQLGIDPRRIAVGGESAGGGLAAALAGFAADRKEIAPVFQLLTYPMLDDRTCLRTDLVDHGFLPWNQSSNRFGWASYLGREPGATETPPHSAPARRLDLSGLPPAWIGVGTLDLFHDEDVAYAQRLGVCGVPCELVVVPGAFHGFDLSGPHLDVVRQFRASQVNAMRKYLLET